MTDDPATAIRRRDLDGLSLPQRRLLQEFALTPDPKVACDQAEVKFSTFRSWLQKDKDFGDAYDELLGRAIELAKDLVEASSVRASGVFEEALTAVKISALHVNCPSCNERFEVEASRPDWTTRLKAANAIAKISGLIVDQYHIEKIVFQPTLEEMVAIAKARRGDLIPPIMRTHLLASGVNLDPDT